MEREVDFMNAEYTGKKIAELRKVKNMTQRELADKLYVTDKAVSKWERGANFPDLGLMEELAEALDTTPSVLLGLEDSTKEEIVASFAEISNQQTEDAERDIQKIGWINLFAGIFLAVFMHFINIKLQRNGLFFESRGLLWMIYGLIAVITIGALYTLKKYKAIREFDWLDAVLAEAVAADVLIFLGIQLFTGSNPHYAVSAIMIGVGVVCIQFVFYRVMKPQLVKVLPLIFTACWLCWGILLKTAQSSWAKSSPWNLPVFYVMPMAVAMITWMVCRKRDPEKDKLFPGVKLLASIVAAVTIFVSLFAQDLLVKTYVKVFHNHLENYAENLLETSVSTALDRYGFWKVTCYPEDELVEFHTGGAGLVFNSTYLGFYYSPDNTHKVFQGADIPLNVNKDLADWYGEGDNWGRSTRLLDKWFCYEANF